MGTMASQITSLTIVYSTVYSGTYQRKHQSSASLAFVRGIHPGPVNSLHKGPVTRKMFPFDDVIMINVSESHVRQLWTHCNCHYLPMSPWSVKSSHTALYCEVNNRFMRRQIRAFQQQRKGGICWGMYAVESSCLAVCNTYWPKSRSHEFDISWILTTPWAFLFHQCQMLVKEYLMLY